MSEALARIIRSQRQVMWHSRLLSLQDALIVASTISVLIGTALVLLSRLRPIEFPLWMLIIGAGMSFGAALARWYLTRASAQDAAFLIDESLELDDRTATSNSIIKRGGPKQALEEALIEDTAERIGSLKAPSVLRFRVRRWYVFAIVAVFGLAASLMIPARTLPVSVALATERADIERAGEHLERTGEEVARVVPPGTETATLAKEQAEIGRGFRLSTATRGDALRRLSALEERLRQRRNDLANTQAEEIVSLADRRLGATLSSLSSSRRKIRDTDESRVVATAQESSGATRLDPLSENSVTPNAGKKPTESAQQESDTPGQAGSRIQAPTVEDQPGKDPRATGYGREEPHKRLQEPVSGKGLKPGSVSSNSADSGSKLPKAQPGEEVRELHPGEQKTGELKSDVPNSADDRHPGEPPANPAESLKAIPDSLTGQAVKVLPKISEELLKKAAELRANEISPADIEKLRKAAELLSHDLAEIGQSQDLQQALQEMARQIRPEQIETVARALGNQEKLKQELDAAVRLLAENRQAKDMVAGIARQFAQKQDLRLQGDNRRNADKPDVQYQANRARSRSLSGTRAGEEKAPGKLGSSDRQLDGQGRGSDLQGKFKKGSGGEYLYLQSKAGMGAARAPYARVYPQYRRDAERSVQRTDVPPNLRSVVRKYFDAINPDARK